MSSIKHKIRTGGAAVNVEPMPKPDLLANASKETREAVEALREANKASKAASKAAIQARKVLRAEEVPSKVSALEDEVHAAEQAERDRLNEARSAARTVVRLLDAEADDLTRQAARLQVDQHVRACDAYAALVTVVGAQRWSLARPPHMLAAFADPAAQAKPSGVEEYGRYLDETNVEDPLERAGMTPEEAGLVLVYKQSNPAIRFYTTAARAGVLGPDFRRADEEDDK